MNEHMVYPCSSGFLVQINQAHTIHIPKKPESPFVSDVNKGKLHNYGPVELRKNHFCFGLNKQTVSTYCFSSYIIGSKPV